ncbi:MAG TPA: ABC transporter permease [Vicinamibacteria bacterium]|nr:ABC transporter permease [Vicinamibacteria bacterium]
MDDVRQALRRLVKRPAFLMSATAILTLGIGFNTVVFSLMNLLVLKPLPVRQPEMLVSLQTGTSPTWSFPNYSDVRERATVFDDVAAMRVIPAHMNRNGAKMRLWGYLVTGNYFDLLGVSASRGRLFSRGDDLTPGAHPVVVLSYASWQRRFAGDPRVVGSTVTLNEHSFTIIGVTPPGFLGTERLLSAEIWVPFSMVREIEGRDWRTSRRTQNAWVIGRLKEGISTSEAEASLGAVAEQLAREYPDSNEGMDIRLAPMGLLGTVLRAPAIGFGTALLMVSGLTLLVACANLSNLLLARASERRKELALRRSLGASRWALARILLAESLLVALAWCIGGILASFWLSRPLIAALPAIEFPINAELFIDTRVLAWSGIAALASAFWIGLVPAARSAAVDPLSALKSETPVTAIGRLGLSDIYVGAQVVVSVVLVAGALMTVGTLKSALEQRYGFTPENAVALRFDVSMHGYDEERGRVIQSEVLRAVSSLPGIESSGLANSIPFSIDQSFTTIYIEGRPVPPVFEAPAAVLYQATPGLFRALGTRLVAGRDFDERDDLDRPKVAIVNETFVRTLLQPDENPLGKRLRFGPDAEPIEIIGVVEAGRYQTVTEEPQYAVWLPLAQSYNSTSTVVARTRLSEREALSGIERAIESVAPDLVLFDAMSLEAYLDLPTAPLRLASTSLGAMGSLAAILSAFGLYALVAHAASRRTREMGIRMALGAGKKDVVRALLKRTVFLVAAGATCGVLLSYLVGGILARLTFTQPTDAAAVAAAVLMTIAAIAASWLPARRALRIEPLEALRYD